MVDAVISDWESKPKLKQALNKLKLTGWSTTLKSENANFSNIYQLRLDDKLDSPEGSFTELRASVVDSYRTLCDTNFAYSVISKKSEYQKLGDAINLIINDYQAIIDRRTATNQE